MMTVLSTTVSAMPKAAPAAALRQPNACHQGVSTNEGRLARAASASATWVRMPARSESGAA